MRVRLKEGVALSARRVDDRLYSILLSSLDYGQVIFVLDHEAFNLLFDVAESDRVPEMVCDRGVGESVDVSA